MANPFDQFDNNPFNQFDPQEPMLDDVPSVDESGQPVYDYEPPVQESSSFAPSAVQGLTFGWGDEALAGMAAGIGMMLPESMGGLPEGVSFEDAYQGIREEINLDREAFETQNPIGAIAAEAGGALLTGGIGLAKLAPTGSKLIPRVSGTAAVGAGEGAIYGAGAADEGERLQGAAEGAAIGAITAPVAGEAFRAGGKLIGKMGDRVKQTDDVVEAIELGLPKAYRAGYELKNKPMIEATTQSGEVLALPSKRASVVGSTIQKGKTKANQAREALGLGSGRIKRDPIQQEAMRQGWEDRLVSTVETMSPTDKAKAARMLDMTEGMLEDAEFAATNRPTDILGNAISTQIKILRGIKGEAVKEISKASKNLRGKPIDVMDEVSGFLDNLSELGVTFDGLAKSGDDWIRVDRNIPVSANFDNSIIEFNAAAKRPLKNLISKMSKADGIDAKDVHDLKLTIDDMVTYGKVKHGLAGKGENALKEFRASINNKLRGISSEYEAANVKYKDVLDSVEDLNAATGSKVDIDDPSSIGTELRALTSQRQSRIPLAKAVEKLDDTASKYGYTTDDNVMKQLVFTNYLDKMFDITPDTGFKGQVSEAIADFAGGETVRGAMQKQAKQAIESAQGINTQNQIKAMRNLLKKGSK